MNVKENIQVPPNSKEDGKSGSLIADDVTALHYKPPENRESQMTRHQVAKNDDLKKLSEDSRMDVQVSEKYEQYRDEVLSILSDFPLR